jgi:rubredoxin
MPEFEPVSPRQISAIQRPGCPQCRWQRMLLAKLGSGASGFAVGTFECQTCGYVSATAISDDPMTSDVLGWLASELRPPT